MVIRGVLFDFDGTLTRPGSIDFVAIKKAVGCPLDQPILEFLQGMSHGADRDRAWSTLHEFEMQAAARSVPNAHAETLLRFLISHRIKIGILTRNTLSAIRCALRKFEGMDEADFAAVLTRDDPCLPKPSADGVVEAARRMGLPCQEILMVGDWIYDINAGLRAGVHTAFLTNGNDLPKDLPRPDYIVNTLEQLQDVLQWHIPLPAGKLPNRLLRPLLEGMVTEDASILIGPGIGEDVAAVRWNKEDDVLILKSDPVTLASSGAGYYAVAVNANDVATAGAIPRWLLTTLLFPLETTAAQIRDVFMELQEAALPLNLALCGGHTEVTDAVLRPVIVGQVAGTVRRGHLIDKRQMRPGNHILLTKGIAVEGTCILAREFSGQLNSMGMPADELDRCRNFLADPGISIIREALIAQEVGGITALHDVTEGGVVTALEELSAAGGHQLRVFLDRIPILAETRRVCELLRADPLGVIGSGSLLIACRSDRSRLLETRLVEQGVPVTCIGEVLESGSGIVAVGSDGEPMPWPHFEVDEIARIVESFTKKR
jgi:hydrogenase expression/formation protein HypE